MSDRLAIEQVDKIHSRGFKIVLAITGGGTGAINQLLYRGGGSATLLEAIVPYSAESFAAFIGAKPEKAVCEAAARQMAMAAYQRALKYTPSHDANKIMGVGVTCSLAKNEKCGTCKGTGKVKVNLTLAEKLASATCNDCRADLREYGYPCGPHGDGYREPFCPDCDQFNRGTKKERPDRKNNAFFAVQTRDRTEVCEISLRGIREYQEEDVSHMILEMLSSLTCGVSYTLSLEGQRMKLVSDRAATGDLYLVSLIHGNSKVLYGGNAVAAEPHELIYPGSWNPLHDGHLALATTAEKITGKKLFYELSVTNVDKSPLDYIAIKRRQVQFGTGNNSKLILTNAPRFTDKSSLFPNATFVVGIDTWERILDPKYYGGDKELRLALETFRNNQNKFLVFGRELNGKFETLREPFVVEDYTSSYELATGVPESVFKKTVSSSEIREKQENSTT